MTYELMQRYFYIDFGGSRPSGSVSEGVASAMDMSSGNPEHIGGYQVARPIFAGVESKFGLLLPRYSFFYKYILLFFICDVYFKTTISAKYPSRAKFLKHREQRNLAVQKSSFKMHLL